MSNHDDYSIDAYRLDLLSGKVMKRDRPLSASDRASVSADLGMTEAELLHYVNSALEINNGVFLDLGTGNGDAVLALQRKLNEQNRIIGIDALVSKKNPAILHGLFENMHMLGNNSVAGAYSVRAFGNYAPGIDTFKRQTKELYRVMQDSALVHMAVEMDIRDLQKKYPDVDFRDIDHTHEDFQNNHVVRLWHPKRTSQGRSLVEYVDLVSEMRASGFSLQGKVKSTYNPDATYPEYMVVRYSFIKSPEN